MMKSTGIFLLLACSALLSACETGAVKSSSTVKVYKFDGSISCNQSSGVPLETMREELLKKKVPVISASCGNDGLVRAAVCGIETGRIKIFEISSAAYPVAKSLGYQKLTNLPDYVTVACGGA